LGGGGEMKKKVRKKREDYIKRTTGSAVTGDRKKVGQKELEIRSRSAKTKTE